MKKKRPGLREEPRPPTRHAPSFDGALGSERLDAPDQTLQEAGFVGRFRFVIFTE